mmetsp:Transcript_65909/g.148732  ORF Transcript_65909/g.148732 Transcript_65909/m.148732 type:complete len:341 (+) Transcript_65909:295-1317(+)
MRMYQRARVCGREHKSPAGSSLTRLRLCDIGCPMATAQDRQGPRSQHAGQPHAERQHHRRVPGQLGAPLPRQCDHLHRQFGGLLDELLLGVVVDLWKRQGRQAWDGGDASHQVEEQAHARVVAHTLAQDAHLAVAKGRIADLAAELAFLAVAGHAAQLLRVRPDHSNDGMTMITEDGALELAVVALHLRRLVTQRHVLLAEGVDKLGIQPLGMLAGVANHQEVVGLVPTGGLQGLCIHPHKLIHVADARPAAMTNHACHVSATHGRQHHLVHGARVVGERRPAHRTEALEDVLQGLKAHGVRTLQHIARPEMRGRIPVAGLEDVHVAAAQVIGCLQPAMC